jgi:hypothetical protein
MQIPVILLTLISLISLCTIAKAAPAPTKRIHLFIALCDNASQGIQPVNKKIGNGDDPESNLYWGCDDGANSYFTYPLGKVGSRPLLLTSQFMYPGAFLLHDVIEGWLLRESRPTEPNM